MAKSKTYEMMLKIAGKTDGSLKKACTDAEKNLVKLGDSAKTAMKAAAAAGAALAAATAAAGKALYDLGAEFDSAYDTIRIGTGATGDALAGLKDSMKAVYGQVPAEMSDAAQAIADYNTRLGVTGKTLETLSVQAIKVSDMLDEDLTSVIETSSKAIQQWNIAEEDMADAMDYIFKVSQSTGVGFTDLMAELQKYGAQIEACGFSLEEAAVLLGEVEKAGYDASTIFTALKTAASNAASDGFGSINEGLEYYIDQISNAKSDTDAYSYAVKVFGSKAASTMIDAIKNGTLSIADMTAALGASGESIGAAAADTYDLAEKWQMFKNRIDVALEPVASTVFDTVGEAVEDLMPMVEELLPAIVSGIASIIPQMIEAAKWAWAHKDAILAIAAGVATAVGAYKAYKLAITAYNAAMGIYKIVTAASATGTFTLAGAMTALNIPALAATAAIGLLVAGGILLYKNWDTVKAKAGELGQRIGEIWANISVAVQSTIDAIGARFPLLGAYLQGWWNSIQAAWTNVQAIFSNIIDFIDNVFAGNWSAAWQNIVDIFGNLFGSLINLAKAPVNGAISAINFVLEKVNGISVTIPDWVPGVGGKTLGFNIPTIPQLAAGGIATAPTLAEIGEGGEPEAVLPLSKLSAMLQDGPAEAPLAKLAKMLDDWTKNQKLGQRSAGGGENGGWTESVGGQNQQDGGVDTITFAPVFNFYGPTTPEQAKETGRLSFEEFKRFVERYNAEKRRKNLRASTC